MKELKIHITHNMRIIQQEILLNGICSLIQKGFGYWISSIKLKTETLFSCIKQNTKISQYSSSEKNLIFVLVPSIQKITGGLRMIYALFDELKKNERYHKSKVLLVTCPSKYTYFKDKTMYHSDYIFRFSLVMKYFKMINKLELIIPDLHTNSFYQNLLKSEISNLKKIPHVKIAIFNQNEEYMPSPDVVNRLREITSDLVEITEYEKYCNRERLNKYHIPIHWIPTTTIPEQFTNKKYSEKENIIVYTKDNCTFGTDGSEEAIDAGKEIKQKILEKLRRELPEFKQILVENMKYEDYKKLIANSKYVITFGEGCDLYFVESTYSGSIAFTVYNEHFPSKEYLKFDNVFSDYNEMYNNIVNVISTFNNNTAQYTTTNYKLKKLLINGHNFDGDYHSAVEKYSKNDYTIKIHP